MLFRRLCVTALVLTAAGGCDGLLMTRSCDLREVDDHCQEYGVYGPDLLALEGTCAAVGGTWGRDACPREGILAGCEDVDPSNPWSVTKWYYAGLDEDLVTSEDVAAECEPDTEVFVAAPE